MSVEHGMVPTVLVTGGTGRVGTMVRNAWCTLPVSFKPVYLGRRAPADIRWPTDLSRALPRAEAVVSMWGRTDGGPEQLIENLALARASRDLAIAAGAKRVFHLSSSSVYGPGIMLTEADALKPVTEYGKYKAHTEELISAFSDSDIEHIILRVANVVGADSLAPIFQGDQVVTLDQFSDGHGPLRSYIGAMDLARILSQLIASPDRGLPSVLNIATPAPLAMEDLILSAGRGFNWRPAPKTALKEVSLDTGRLKQLLPDLGLEMDTTRLVDNFRRLSRAA